MKRRTRSANRCPTIFRVKTRSMRRRATVRPRGSTSFLKAADKVVEVMEHVPASVKVVRHIEKRLICKDCDTTVAGEMPKLPITRGKPGPSLLAHIMVAKFDDHIPLYRLSEMYERMGIDISRSVMADWVGRVSLLIEPLVMLVKAYVVGTDRIHTDDTPVDVLDPGRGTTATGRLWAYVFDGSGYKDDRPKAVAYYYSADRKGIHPEAHLADFSGVMHADGYGGYKKLYGNKITEAACMAHVRRKFHDVIKLKASPVARGSPEPYRRALRTVEARIHGMTADERRALRQQHARPLLDSLKAWIEGDAADRPAEAEAGGGHALCLIAMGGVECLHRRWACRDR
ncbi:IS66 family transposase [Asticcacaulis excentricus]|uniref:IS66 family transposase n=1 Tax=Asticcacaulis excentricus TaxID=78587 RepID=UPI00315CC77C